MKPKVKYDEVYVLKMDPNIDFLFYDFEIAEDTKNFFLSKGHKLLEFYKRLIFKTSPFMD